MVRFESSLGTTECCTLKCIKGLILIICLHKETTFIKKFRALFVDKDRIFFDLLKKQDNKDLSDEAGCIQGLFKLIILRDLQLQQNQILISA